MRYADLAECQSESKFSDVTCERFENLKQYVYIVCMHEKHMNNVNALGNIGIIFTLDEL